MRPFKVNSRDSAHQIGFAVQILKIRGYVPRSAAEKPRKDSAGFFDFGREKVSVWELSDDFGTACGPFLLVGETVVSRQPDSGTESCSVPLYALYIV